MSGITDPLTRFRFPKSGWARGRQHRTDLGRHRRRSGLLLCVAGFFGNRAQFFQSYLFAFLYWGGFAFGGLGILLLNNTVGGRWGVTTRSFLEAAMRTLPCHLRCSSCCC